MLWLMYLCPSSINASRKRNVISQVWSWSGETFPSGSRWLHDDVLAGIGSAGPGFNQNQWRELVFLTRFMSRFGGLPPNQQQSLLADPWQFADAVAPETRADLFAAAESFATALREANVSLGQQHDELIRVVLASLATKPFLILTGMSGSGKTQIAVRLGEWLGSRAHVAAVRPDWTGAEALFGYEDALRLTEGGRAAWSVPPALEFMLKALHDPHHPYLLVLDEMNLAHVERYFADVLSGMESQQRCLPNLSKESDGCWRVAVGADLRVPFPRNLWIIGTVNVDETTYMFSPKVLDRASTLEFRVTSDDLIAEARKPVPCRPSQRSPDFIHMKVATALATWLRRCDGRSARTSNTNGVETSPVKVPDAPTYHVSCEICGTKGLTAGTQAFGSLYCYCHQCIKIARARSWDSNTDASTSYTPESQTCFVVKSLKTES